MNKELRRLTDSEIKRAENIWVPPTEGEWKKEPSHEYWRKIRISQAQLSQDQKDMREILAEIKWELEAKSAAYSADKVGMLFAYEDWQDFWQERGVK